MEENTKLVLIDIEDVVLDLRNETNKNSIYSGIWNDCCNKIEIHSADSFKELYLRCKKLLLNGIFNLEVLQLECLEELLIGKKSDLTIINLTRWSGKIWTEKLNLTNCIIINNNDKLQLNITYKILTGENFIIKSKSDIIINGKIFSKHKDEEGYFTITINDIIDYNSKNISNQYQDENKEKELEIKKLQVECNLFQEEYKEIQKKNIIKTLKRNKTNDINKIIKFKNI